ncbi:MAG: hypothetical protein ACRDHP_06740 [Ktedonobacterales bacterium]
MTSVYTQAIVGPDGALDLHVANLPPGQRVSVTIEVPDAASSALADEVASHTAPHPTALDLMTLPLEERHRILAQTVADAAEAFRTDPELMEFSALDGEDWENAGE